LHRPPQVSQRCGCLLTVNTTGPDMRLQCPTAVNITDKAALAKSMAGSKLECVGSDGKTYDLTALLTTGELRAPAGSASASGPNRVAIIAAVISVVVALVLAGVAFVALKRYQQERRSRSFQSLKDAAEPAANPLEVTSQQV
jgi:hypothetical protein